MRELVSTGVSLTEAVALSPEEAAHCVSAKEGLRTAALVSGEEAEVLAFLSARPLSTVLMSSYIRDNGLESPLNRGRFYGCRNHQNRLEGVALIGHTTLFEARSKAAVESFARVAQSCPEQFLLIGERNEVCSFWHHYAGREKSPRLLCDVLMLELERPFNINPPLLEIRPATTDELDSVMEIHAAMVFEETRVNSLDTDPVGFRARCLRRIEQRRTWLLVKDGVPIFKADIIARTPQAAYLEGVYVSAKERSQGYGRRCLAQMCNQLLRGSRSICLFVEEENRRAQSFYLNLGFGLYKYCNLLYF